MYVVFFFFVKYSKTILASAKNPEKIFQRSFFFFFFLLFLGIRLLHLEKCGFVLSWQSESKHRNHWECLEVGFTGILHSCLGIHAAQQLWPCPGQTRVQKTFTLCETEPLLRAKRRYIQQSSTHRSHAKGLIWIISSFSTEMTHQCIYSCFIWYITLCHRRLRVWQKLAFQVICTCFISQWHHCLLLDQCLSSVPATRWHWHTSRAWMPFFFFGRSKSTFKCHRIVSENVFNSEKVRRAVKLNSPTNMFCNESCVFSI